jgi:hypothetical protein
MLKAASLVLSSQFLRVGEPERDMMGPSVLTSASASEGRSEDAGANGALLQDSGGEPGTAPRLSYVRGSEQPDGAAESERRGEGGGELYAKRLVGGADRPPSIEAALFEREHLGMGIWLGGQV